MEFSGKHYIYKDFVGNALAWHIWRLIASKMNGLNVIPNHFLNIAILKFHFSFRRVLTSTTVKKYLKRMYWYDTLFFFYSQTSLHSFYIFIGCFRGIFFIHFLFLPYISQLWWNTLQTNFSKYTNILTFFWYFALPWVWREICI